jgi:hypothetical protein
MRPGCTCVGPCLWLRPTALPFAGVFLPESTIQSGCLYSELTISTRWQRGTGLYKDKARLGFLFSPTNAFFPAIQYRKRTSHSVRRRIPAGHALNSRLRRQPFSQALVPPSGARQSATPGISRKCVRQMCAVVENIGSVPRMASRPFEIIKWPICQFVGEPHSCSGLLAGSLPWRGDSAICAATRTLLHSYDLFDSPEFPEGKLFSGRLEL